MRCFIELMLNRESQEQLSNYCLKYDRLITNPKIKGSLHSTVYHSSVNPLFMDTTLIGKLSSFFPLEIDPKTYFFDIFEKCLVLRYENDLVRSVHELLDKDVERQKTEVWPNLAPEYAELLRRFNSKVESDVYPQLNPHITLSKEFYGNNLKKLPAFDKMVAFDWANIKYK